MVERMGFEEENKRLKKALQPFVSYKHFLDAIFECEKRDPLTEHDAITSIMGCGGSDYIWYGDLMRAEQALKGTADG